ncbi:MAG: FadR/GntR family transcriptional regulator [Syntrophaceae bacterium]|nr:FadR/GntR family transcriptional regulator [Syntrophaceae bacterium]
MDDRIPTDSLDQSVFKKIKSERLSEKVASQLKKAISQGIFRVGEKLPSQPDLAEMMGVSRPSVREAIQILEIQGMLESVKGGGTTVRNIAEQSIRKPIEIFLDEDKNSIIDLTEVRALMEVWAARKAAQTRTDQEADRMLEYLLEMENDFKANEIRFEVDVKFHMEVASATHNVIFAHLIDSVFQLITRAIRLAREKVFLDRHDQKLILQHHRSVYEAIRDRDPDKAEAAMRTHLNFVINEFTTRLVSATSND